MLLVRRLLLILLYLIEGPLANLYVFITTVLWLTCSYIQEKIVFWLKPPMFGGANVAANAAMCY